MHSSHTAYTICEGLSNNLCLTPCEAAGNLAAMAEKSISWRVVEAWMNGMGVTHAEFRERMGVESNVITNWKTRGVPRGRAAEVAAALGITIDELFRRKDPGSARIGVAFKPAGGSGAPIPLQQRHRTDVQRLVLSLRRELAAVDEHIRGSVMLNLQSMVARINEEKHAEHIASVIAQQLAPPPPEEPLLEGNGVE